MNNGVLIFGNLIFWTLLGIILDVENRLPSSNFFNKSIKCYYFKKINESKLPNILRNEIKINENGESKLYNERGRFIRIGILIPISMLLFFWPVYYLFPNTLISYFFLTSLGVLLYYVIFVFLRFKINKTELIDENYPYYISYTIFSLKYNVVNVLKISFYVYGVLMSNAIIAKIILCILIVHLHAYIFIDKIDKFFNLKILEKNKLDWIGYIEHSLTLLLISLFLLLPVNNGFVLF